MIFNVGFTGTYAIELQFREYHIKKGQCKGLIFPKYSKRTSTTSNLFTNKHLMLNRCKNVDNSTFFTSFHTISSDYRQQNKI